MYTEQDLIKIAKRENNKKRPYLIVNKLQAKHIPTAPSQAFKMFDALAERLEQQYAGERLLLVGFAETATAIGARLAVRLHAYYIQTTREQIPGVSYLYFTEAPSHATEQKLVKEDIDQVIDRVDRIIFAEDEVTTGNTIFGIIKILQRQYPKKAVYSVASLLNGMDLTAEQICREQKIDLAYLRKISHAGYAEAAEAYAEDGTYVLPDTTAYRQVPSYRIFGYQNARRLVMGDAYEQACRKLWEDMREFTEVSRGERVLVIGTEECMYPALYVGDCIERLGGIVLCHSTTRSPIAVSSNADYPLHTRYELESLYEAGRKTFIYDLAAYDSVIILTDASDENGRGAASLWHALRGCGNRNIRFFRWCAK